MRREYWTLETSWHPYYPWSLILIWTQPDIYFRKAQNTQTSEQLCVLSFSTTNGQETKPVRSWLEVNCSTSAPKWQIGFLMLPGWIFWPDFLVYTNTIQVTVHSMNLVVISNFFLTYCFRVECFLVMLQGKRIMPSCQSVFRIPTMKAAGESFSRSPPGGFCVALKGSEAAVVGRWWFPGTWREPLLHMHATAEQRGVILSGIRVLLWFFCVFPFWKIITTWKARDWLTFLWSEAP